MISPSSIWDAETGEVLRAFDALGDSVYFVAFSPDGKTLVSLGGRDGSIQLWNVRTGTLVRTLRGHEDKVWQVIYSPDGKTLVSKSGDATIHVWDAETGALIRTLTRTLPGYKYRVSSVAFSPDGKLLASGSEEDAIVKLWDIRTGALIRTFGVVGYGRDQNIAAYTWTFWSEHQYGVTAVAFSPDGRKLASGSVDPRVMLRDVETEEPKGSDGKR